MTRKAKIWLTSALGFAGYLGFAYSLPRWLSLPDKRALLLFGLLAVIGLGAWLFTAIFLSKRQPAPPPPQDPLSLEMDAAITQTERRLVDARVARGDVLHKLPAVFVLGPRQHHKTSSVIRSGVHAELLAGDVLRGSQVVPTQTINTWFAGQAVVAEVGVDVVQAPERFSRFLARFQPARLSNALASGEQAPRAVLVCYSCEALRLPGARDATLIAARELRGTLSTIAQSYGIRLPVYVLFTKTDDLPGFKEFARRFTTEEARDVLGATLPLQEMRAAEYADRASHAYRTELLTLFESLATRRVDVLAREDAAEHRPRAYQFPRELRKLEPLIAEFLVELGRPSDLSTSPFVRGFYFSGVREVVVGDGEASVVAASPAATRVSEEAGATALLGALPAPSFALHGAGRREAQWVFLDRLLSQVVLNDAAALGITRGGTRISFFRRATLGAAAAAAALLIVAQLNAFRANARLQASVQRHTEAVMGLPATPVAAPAVAELAILDSLGNSLDALSGYTWGRTPVHLRWGLYQGDTLYGTTHAAYFRQFRRLLFDSTFATIASSLRGMSATPQTDAQFARDYARLKAYLVVTDSTTHANDALGGVLLANWGPAAQLDTNERALALRQFERYARELRRRNPYQLPSDPAVIAQARMALRQAASDQRIYLGIIQTASDSLPGINFNRDYGSAGALFVSHSIPGAFTRDGYVYVSRAIQNLDDYLNVDPWVLEPESVTGAAVDRVVLERMLKARYDSHFVDHWRTFVRSASMPGSGAARDVAQRLGVLGGTQSPIMRVFALVNQHTGIGDSARVRHFFDPIRLLGAENVNAPPPPLIVPYLQKLAELGQQLLNVADRPPEAQNEPIEQAFSKVTEATNALNGALQPLGQRQGDFRIDTLLGRPLTVARNTLNQQRERAGVATALQPVVEAGALLCQSFSELSKRRPFSRVPSAEWAAAADLAAVLSSSGSLATQLQNGLGGIFFRQGRDFAAGASGSLQPDPQALTFINQLNRIARAFYPPGANEPQLQFTIAPVLTQTVPTVGISFGEKFLEFDNRRTQAQRVLWRLGADRVLSLNHPRDRNSRWEFEEGPWAPMFFFKSGRNWRRDGSDRWRFEYVYEGIPMEFIVVMESEVHDVLLDEAFEPRLDCPKRWVRAGR